MSAYPRSGFRRGYRPRQVPEEAHRINENITAREVRLVDDAGEQRGIIPTSDALMEAERAGLDLVEVAPQAKPPVCKLMDYGKFKYREQKKEAQARKRRTENTIKELRVRYSTDSGDLATKYKQAREFLGEGDKVKFSLRFRGRENQYIDLGMAKLDEIIEELSDVATVDDRSPAQPRQIYVVLAPSKS